MSPELARLQRAVAPLQAAVVDHPVYGLLTDQAALGIFMEHHAFCVWDFMCLVSFIQQEVTCVETRWQPRGMRDAARLINEIKLAEESDAHPDGGWCSHYELYLDAMREQNVSTFGIDRYVRREQTWSAPPAALEFVQSTHTFIGKGLVAATAAFAFGRESLIPSLFEPLLARTDGVFRYYLDRHIALDGDDHQHKAAALVQAVCRDPADWAVARDAAFDALLARYRLWTAVAEKIEVSRG